MVKEVNKEHKNVEMTRKKKRSGIVYFDYSLLAILICLVCFGLVMLYSTSSYSAMMKQNGDSLFYFKRQLLFCIVGFIGMWLVSKIDYHWYINKSKLFYFFSIFMMFLVKTPLGKEVNGAKRWIKLPFGFNASCDPKNEVPQEAQTFLKFDFDDEPGRTENNPQYPKRH